MRARTFRRRAALASFPSIGEAAQWSELTGAAQEKKDQKTQLPLRLNGEASAEEGWHAVGRCHICRDVGGECARWVHVKGTRHWCGRSHVLFHEEEGRGGEVGRPVGPEAGGTVGTCCHDMNHVCRRADSSARSTMTCACGWGLLLQCARPADQKRG